MTSLLGFDPGQLRSNRDPAPIPPLPDIQPVIRSAVVLPLVRAHLIIKALHKGHIAEYPNMNVVELEAFHGQRPRSHIVEETRLRPHRPAVALDGPVVPNQLVERS